MDSRKVFSSSQQFTHEFLTEWANRDKSIEPIKKPYSALAERLIDKRIKKENEQVKIDHLAFSFRLSELRHCAKAGFSACSVNTLLFPQMPKIENHTAQSDESIQRHKEFVSNQLADFYIKTLTVFVEYVLGFELSLPRDKGFHGYKNSITLLAGNGSEVGFIGIGGQQDTVYIQISGQGCQYLFSHINNFDLHHWLSKVLSITHLSRVDLACDDYDQNFDCRYAHSAYREGWFRTGKGGKMASMKIADEFTYDNDFNKIFSVEMINIGQRSSPVYWRIYNKKLEQGIQESELVWYRSEVELKKWNVDALLNPDLAFAGINKFAQSMINNVGIRTKSMSKSKQVCLELASRVKWFRHASGKALVDILEILDGDIEAAIGMILPDKSGQKLGIPPTHKQLINYALEQ